MRGQRFSARPHEDGDGYGVHDTAFGQWSGPTRYTKERAEQIAADLELHHQRTEAARETATAGRPVEPPQPVRARVTLVIGGLLHAWSRSEGGWMGEVELKPDRRIWVKADDLEQT